MLIISPSLPPRRYHTKVYEVALKRNIIESLETGASKTMIAVLLINHIGQHFGSISLKKLIFFLASIVHVVNQQYRYKEYHGDKGVND